MIRTARIIRNGVFQTLTVKEAVQAAQLSACTQADTGRVSYVYPMDSTTPIVGYVAWLPFAGLGKAKVYRATLGHRALPLD